MLESVQEIQPGMIVKLKGSIMPMSVNSMEGNTASCYWFEGHTFNKSDFNTSEIAVVIHNISSLPILAGNKVTLRSGGPVMHVERIEFKKNKPHAICTWQFNNSHYLKKFSTSTLLAVKD